jgi:hypothetical protein
MPALMLPHVGALPSDTFALRRVTLLREGDAAVVRVLQATIETLRAENEILERRLAAAEARAAARDRCPWWCLRPRK